MEKKRTNSGPFMESTSKHNIYPPTAVRPRRNDFIAQRPEQAEHALERWSR